MNPCVRVAVLASVLPCSCGALEAQTTRSIAGRVLDAEGNGAAGAEIVLRWRVHPELPGLVGYSLGGRGVAESRHTADREGRYRVEPVHVGPFQVVAFRGDQSSAQVFPVMRGDYTELRLEPSHFVGGVVVDGDGAPVAGADVRLLPDPSIWSRLALYRIPERRGETRTDGEGRFRLHFEHGYLRGPFMAPLVGVWVENGTLTNLPHQLVRPNLSSTELTLGLHERVAVSGTVRDEAGRPIEGARIFDPAWPDGARSTSTDGAYEAPVPASFALCVSAPGFEPTLVRGSRPRFSERIDWRLRKGLTLRVRLLATNGEPLSGARVLFALPDSFDVPFEQVGTVVRDGTVSIDWAPSGLLLLGFVEMDGLFVQFHGRAIEEDTDLGDVMVSGQRTLEGQLVASDRSPVAHARVVLQTQGLEAVMPRVTYTDRGGRFRFDAVVDLPQVVIGGAGSHGMTAQAVPPDAFHDPLQLTLAEGFEIGGMVVDPRGDPVPGAWVMISRGGGVKALELPAPSLTATTLCTITDREGRFRFRGLPDGGSWSIMGQYLRDGTVSAGGGTALNGSRDLVIGVTTHVR